MKTAILHIGLPETGTTSIQRMLFEASRKGALPGVGYHLPFPDNMHSQHLLWALFRKDRPLSRWPQFVIDNLPAGIRLEETLERCWEQMAQSDRLVLSSEYLPSWTTQEIEALAARLRSAGFSRVHVVIYVREPAQAYLSQAQQFIRAANRLPLPEEFNSGYQRAIERFRTIFGHVEVRIFDRKRLVEGCAVRDFLSVVSRELGVQPVREEIMVVNANDTLSAEAMIVLLEWRRAHFSDTDAVTEDGNRLVKILLDSRHEIAQTKPALKDAVAQVVRSRNAGEIAYLRDLGIEFDALPPTADSSLAVGTTDTDPTSILASHDPQVVSALRDFVRQRMPGSSRTQSVAAETAPQTFADHVSDRAWRLLQQGPCELHFIGASVTAQKQSWADELCAKLVQATGHPHVATKNVMGGVGILFGLGFFASPSALPRIAFIEFSTGDFNVGLSPASELGWMIEALVARVRDEGGEAYIVHNWRADNLESEDKRGVFAAYDEISRRFHVGTIRNNRWVDQQLQRDPAMQKHLFRDVCHTTPAGVQAYAQHALDVLRTAPAENEVGGTESARQPPDWPRVFHLDTHLLQGNTVSRAYAYPGSGQLFEFHELPQGSCFKARVSGRLMGVGFISGPTAGWAGLFVDGKLVRRFRCFDRHSYYERYILLPVFVDLHEAIVELRLLDEPVDVSIAQKHHPDFELPRRVMPAHVIGTRLVAVAAS